MRMATCPHTTYCGRGHRHLQMTCLQGEVRCGTGQRRPRMTCLQGMLACAQWVYKSNSAQ
eukprot:1153421-Pelagomonas_calceolata.AAC.7